MLSPTLLNTATAVPASRLNSSTLKSQENPGASFQSHFQQQVDQNKPVNQQSCKSDSSERGSRPISEETVKEKAPDQEIDSDRGQTRDGDDGVTTDKEGEAQIAWVDKPSHRLAGTEDDKTDSTAVAPLTPPATLPLDPGALPTRQHFSFQDVQFPALVEHPAGDMLDSALGAGSTPEVGLQSSPLEDDPLAALIQSNADIASDLAPVDKVVQPGLLFTAAYSSLSGAGNQVLAASSQPAQDVATSLMTPEVTRQDLFNIPAGIHNLLASNKLSIGNNSLAQASQATSQVVTADPTAVLAALEQMPGEGDNHPKIERVMPGLLASNASDISSLTQQQNSNVERAQSRVLMPATLAAPGASQTLAPDFVNRFSEQVMWLRHQNINIAELRLHPRDLGSVLVRIDSSGDNTSVNFVAGHQHVRDVLDQNMTKLRELFTDAGLSLGNVNVSGESSSQKGQGFHGSSDSFFPGALQRFNADGRVINDAGADESVTVAAASIHIVDFFA